ncbi:MAG: putative rane protein, partial [Bacillota bacterium]|nr:putative rane protein [Bacillota bacterium]
MKKHCFIEGYRKYIIMIKVFLISLCFFSAVIFNVYGDEFTGNNGNYDIRNILILNSYDEGYRWTNEQSKAITDRLKAEFDDILIYVEYMDTKYHPERGNLLQLYELYSYKYADI